MMKSIFLIAILVSAPVLIQADDSLSVDARFDLTGDGIVDASDWAKMSEDAKQAYANASIQALGENPHALLEGKQSRGERYLQGLRAVYE
ncbi:MAG: hypothetical protein Q9M16_06745 [Mariprofundus sp.]|nr:hypothetical protein [Mariprofundus sp.]